MNIIFAGGLGNQMFQYALYLSLKNAGKRVKINTALYASLQMHNGYELDKIFSIASPPKRFSKFYLFWIKFVLKYRPEILVHTDYKKYDDTVFFNRKPYITGYWQSEQYFVQIKELVLSTFVFSNIDEKNRLTAMEMQNVNSVSIHIRRGDYVGNTAHDGVCSSGYYNKAIATILSTINNIHFYIFSDDTQWAEQFVSSLSIRAKVIDWNKGMDSYKDMYLMSQCKHNIIANSTFSWWGAWLNKNPQKTVIAPATWFPNVQSELYQDIVPVRWIKI